MQSPLQELYTGSLLVSIRVAGSGSLHASAAIFFPSVILWTGPSYPTCVWVTLGHVQALVV